MSSHTIFLKELKKGDVFKFNNKLYAVKRKFLGNDKYGKERPLITTCDERFYFDELLIEKITKIK